MDIYWLFVIERHSIILGLSTLDAIAKGYMKEKPSVKISIPNNLIKLIKLASEGSQEHQSFLISIANDFCQEPIEISPEEFSLSLHRSFMALYKMDEIIEISDEDIDDEIMTLLENSFEDDRYYITLSPKKNFVKEFYVKALSWAKTTGALIIERTTQLFNKVGHFIATLQIPDRFNRFMDLKEKHIDRLFSFKGGKLVKWFVAAISGTLGIAYPVFGMPGLILTYMDP